MGNKCKINHSIPTCIIQDDCNNEKVTISTRKIELTGNCTVAAPAIGPADSPVLPEPVLDPLGGILSKTLERRLTFRSDFCVDGV
jgi:hypothetical protein